MFEKLRGKLKEEGRSFSWWVAKYLPGYKYNTIMAQINGFATKQDYLTDAIDNYMEEK